LGFQDGVFIVWKYLKGGLLMTEVKRLFTVGGKPFYPLGGQAHNSSGFNASEADTGVVRVIMCD
jgi:hypothetical protein